MTRLAALVAFLLASVTLSGCLGDQGEDDDNDVITPALERSQELFGMLAGQSVFYDASADGTRLHLRLFLPDTKDRPDWRSPTILVMSPYFGPDSKQGGQGAGQATVDPAAPPSYWRYIWLIDHFVPRGYAVAFADVRGTGESGGCLEQTARLQTQDGYATVEFLAAQEWSNQKVGMYGKSYDGETQQSTATLAPPHLTTIVPVSSVAGQYDYSYYDGVPYTLQTMTSNAFYVASDGMQPGSSKERVMQYPLRAGCNGEILLQGADESGDWNDFWEEREFRKQVENVNASVLYVHGLQDWNVKPSNIRDWFEHLDVPKVALLGQWAHDYPEQNTYRSDWSRQDWQDLVWRWFDHWLLGLDTGVEELLGQVQIQDTLGRWRVEEAFPPKSTELRFWLSDGALTNASTETEDTFMDWPFPNPLGVFSDQALLVDEGLTYTSGPLAAPLHWSGWPTLALNVSLDRDDAHFAVHLLDIGADGTERWVDRAYLSARHRDGVEAPKPVPTDQAITYGLRFFPSDTVIEAGHSLGVRIMPFDDWTMGARNGYTAAILGGMLTFPTVAPTDFLNVTLGEPITKPVVE